MASAKGPRRSNMMVISGTKASVNHKNEFMGQEAEALYNRIRFTEPLITKDMDEITKSHGTRLAGLEYSVKTADSVSDKLMRIEKESHRKFGNLDKEREVRIMKDIVRYTEICAHSKIFDTARESRKELEKRGYVLSAVRNYYKNPYPETGYMGLHMNFITPYGQEVEFQVHSQESFDVKQEGHELYEKIRSVSATIADKDQLKEDLYDLHQSIERPEGYKAVDNYLMPYKERRSLIAERSSQVKVKLERTRDSADRSIPPVVKYEVIQNGKVVLKGFECEFSDQGVWRYVADRENAGITAINKNSTVISSKPAKIEDVSLNRIISWVQRQEKAHDAWMRENYAEKMMEDLGIMKEVKTREGQEAEHER